MKKFAGIHCVVAQKLEHVAVEAVGARLGDGIHHGAAELSVFRVKAVGDKTELLDGVEVRNQTCTEVSSLADVAPVHQKRVGGLALAIY